MIDLFAPRGRDKNLPALADLVEIGDCWEWTGARNSGNRGVYGRIQINGQKWYVHRAFWSALVGPIPDGQQIDHLCKNTLCVNPDHLRTIDPVTHGGLSAPRVARFCPQGHDTFAFGRRKRGTCRECHRLYMVEYNKTYQRPPYNRGLCR